jgi:hypothetical protein
MIIFLYLAVDSAVNSLLTCGTTSFSVLLGSYKLS